MEAMSTVRVQIDLAEARVRELEELMKVCGVSTKKELFNNALTLLEWAVREVRKGNSIASVNDREQGEGYQKGQIALPELGGQTPPQHIDFV